MRADALEGLSGRPGRGPHPGAAMSAAATGNGAARTLGELVGLLEDTYPLDWAESWDRVGLVLGERSAGVDRVLLAVDPTLEVAREAVETGSDLLITHHPLLLRGASFLPADEGKGAVVTTLLRAGTGLWCGHTNVDRSTLGTVGAWARALDLQDSRPLVPPAAEAEGAHGSRLFGLGAVGPLAAPTTAGHGPGGGAHGARRAERAHGRRVPGGRRLLRRGRCSHRGRRLHHLGPAAPSRPRARGGRRRRHRRAGPAGRLPRRERVAVAAAGEGPAGPHRPRSRGAREHALQRSLDRHRRLNPGCIGERVAPHRRGHMTDPMADITRESPRSGPEDVREGPKTGRHGTGSAGYGGPSTRSTTMSSSPWSSTPKVSSKPARSSSTVSWAVAGERVASSSARVTQPR